MKLAVPLLVLALLPVYARADTSPVPHSSATIAATRTGNGCDITLPPAALKTVTDQLWLVVDGKSEGFGGGNYNAALFSMPLHYTGSVSSDLDGQVKDILKAQGLPIKENITTYRVSGGINIPVGGYGFPGASPGGLSVPTYVAPSYIPAGTTKSETLHFRHAAYIVLNVQLASNGAYKIGDKIPIFEAVVLDTSTSLMDAAELNNDFRAGRDVKLPADLMHRITIQVQFVPKATP